MSNYDQHGMFLSRLAKRAQAELQGFLDAKVFSSVLQWSRDPQTQEYYARGFMDGKSILAVEGLEAEKKGGQHGQ